MSSQRLSIALPLLLAFQFTCRAGDWPQWRGPTRDGHLAAEVSLPTTLPREAKVVWRVKAGEGFASPVVAGGTVLLFDNQEGRETLRALADRDGQELWRAPLNEVFKDSQGPPGPRCTPLIDGQRVYAQASRGALHCLDLKTGKPIWSADYVKDFGAVFIGEKGQAQGAVRHGYNGSPVIDGDHVIVAVGSTNGAGVVCFDKTTGKVIWKSQNDQAAYAAPIVAEIGGIRQVVHFSADGVIGLRRSDGKLLWRVPVKTAFSRHVSTPVVHGDLVVSGSHQSGMLGLRIKTSGEEQTATGAWVNKEGSPNFSSPVAVGEYVYGLGPTRNVACVEMATGKTTWSHPGWITSSADKAHAGFFTNGKEVFMLNDGGQLIQFAADPKQAREISRLQVCGVNWCNPAYANGHLYVRDGIKGTGELLKVALAP